MFRKCFAAVIAVILAVGGLFAEDFKAAIFVKYDETKKEATFKIEDKEKVFPVDEDAMIKTKKGEVKLTDALVKVKADSKWDIKTSDKGKLMDAKKSK